MTTSWINHLEVDFSSFDFHFLFLFFQTFKQTLSNRLGNSSVETKPYNHLQVANYYI